MVVASSGRNGLADWLIQRFTALIMGLYALVVVGYLLLHPDLDYQQWSALYGYWWMRYFSLLVFFSLAAHGWIGLWAVLTDYVTARMLGEKALFLRLLILSLYALMALACLVWGVGILWGI